MIFAGSGQGQESWGGQALVVIYSVSGAHNKQTTDCNCKTATAKQQTTSLSPQPYAPDKQGPADLLGYEIVRP